MAQQVEIKITEFCKTGNTDLLVEDILNSYMEGSDMAKDTAAYQNYLLKPRFKKSAIQKTRKNEDPIPGTYVGRDN